MSKRNNNLFMSYTVYVPPVITCPLGFVDDMLSQLHTAGRLGQELYIIFNHYSIS